MEKWLKRIGIVLAISFLALTLLNASWLAPTLSGQARLVAHRGIYQPYDNTDLGRDDCTANRIYPPIHDFQENTAASIKKASEIGAEMIEVDIVPTSDDEIALFHDWTLDCRTEASGDSRDKTLAELQALDIGYGYSADGGKSFPFRGKFVGAMPSLAQGLAAAPKRRFIFNFKSKDASEADLLVAKLKQAGRDVDLHRDAFYGAVEPVRRIKQLYPGAWAFNQQEAKVCSRDYAIAGWFGIMPDSCRKTGTIFVAHNYQWIMPGWPNRLIARMEDAGVEIIMIGPVGPGATDNAPRGLDLPEQLDDVPASFNGWLWVDDIYALGPAMHPSLTKRSAEEDEALARTLEARRQSRD